MTTRIIREPALVRVPWKNGGGATVEIAVHPAGAGFDDFDWRFSMADVAQDGPFSSFPGIDRTLVLVQGEGLTLDVDGVAHHLDRANPMLSFSGEARTDGTLRQGPIRDFNVMTRRGRFAHRVDIVAAGSFDVVGPTLVLAHDGPLSIVVDGEAHRLGLLDCVLIAGTALVEIDGTALRVSVST